MSERFLSIGECMVELSQAGHGLLRKRFAGDTFNTAWYARACFPSTWSIDYLTAIGVDPLSDEMLFMMSSAGIGTAYVRRIEGRTPGLYLITVRAGERSFSYWRDASAAKQLADDVMHLRKAINEAAIIYFSGVTLGILSGNAATALVSELRRAREFGKVVAFDPNIRPRLWANREDMLGTIESGASIATHVFPSFDDEALHFGDANVSATVARYRNLGVKNIAVKNGASGITLAFESASLHVPAVPTNSVVDTTSAGDSFNGAFLAAIAHGRSPADAAAYGATVASAVIGHHGALINPRHLPPLQSLG